MLRRLRFLIESYAFVLFVALTAGIFASHQFAVIAPFGKVFLGGIFFLSALRLELGAVLGHLRNAKLLIIVNGLMLVGFPVIVFFVTDAVAPSLAIAFLLAAMPAGMTSLFLAELSGGTQSLALVLTVTTSLLAPVTVPLVMKLLAGTHIAVGFWAMVASLAKVIFIPFIAAQVVRAVWGARAVRFARRSRPLSMLLLGLLLLGIVAQRADVIRAGLGSVAMIGTLAGLLALFAFHFVAGYFALPGGSQPDRISVMICLTFMNFTLAIFLAGQYFSEPGILVPVILSVLPWSLLLIPFRAFMGRLGVR